jgi:DNA-binding CsgD family transcriptional regulator
MLAGVNLRLPPDKLFLGRAVPFLPGLRSSTLNLGRHKTRALGKEMLPSKLIRLLLVVVFFCLQLPGKPLAGKGMAADAKLAEGAYATPTLGDRRSQAETAQPSTNTLKTLARYYLNRQLDTAALFVEVMRERAIKQHDAALHYEALALSGSLLLRQEALEEAAKVFTQARALEDSVHMPAGVAFEMRLAMTELMLWLDDSARAFSYHQQAALFWEQAAGQAGSKMPLISSKLRLSRHFKLASWPDAVGLDAYPLSCKQVLDQEFLPEWYVELAMWQLDLGQSLCSAYLLSAAQQSAVASKHTHALAHSWLGKGKLAQFNNNPKSAVACYTTALELATHVGNQILLSELHYLLYKGYASLGSSDSSAYHHLAFIKTRRAVSVNGVFETLDASEEHRTHAKRHAMAASKNAEEINQYLRLTAPLLLLLVGSLFFSHKYHHRNFTQLSVIDSMTLQQQELEQQAIFSQNSTLMDEKKQIVQLLLAIKQQRYWMTTREKLEHLNHRNQMLDALAPAGLLQVPSSLGDEQQYKLLVLKIMELNKPFVVRLEADFPGLSFQQKFMCVLVVLGLDKYEIAELTATKPSSVSMALTRLRQKLQVASVQHTLFDFLRAYVVASK